MIRDNKTRARLAEHKGIIIALYQSGRSMNYIATYIERMDWQLRGKLVAQNYISELIKLAGVWKPRHIKSTAPRNKEIMAARAAGKTLAAIGEQYKISRERVRQIVGKTA